jgi:hypothetical protein
MVDLDGKLHQMVCKVYTKIEGKEKVLAAKLDSLWKHNGMKNTLVVILSL